MQAESDKFPNRLVDGADDRFAGAMSTVSMRGGDHLSNDDVRPRAMVAVMERTVRAHGRKMQDGRFRVPAGVTVGI